MAAEVERLHNLCARSHSLDVRFKDIGKRLAKFESKTDPQELIGRTLFVTEQSLDAVEASASMLEKLAQTIEL
jgi:hypothetical protein